MAARKKRDRFHIEQLIAAYLIAGCAVYELAAGERAMAFSLCVLLYVVVAGYQRVQ